MKNELRQKLFNIRENIVNRIEKERAIAKKVFNFIKEKRLSTFFSYVSMGSEVDTEEIIKELHKFSEYKILIPFTIGSHMIAVVYEDEKLITDKTGNVQGIVDKPEFCGKIDLSITPLLGFNSQNHRIGYGKGCYDKYYARHSVQNKVGIAFDEQEIEFKQDSFDIPLDIIFTPTRVITKRGEKL